MKTEWEQYKEKWSNIDRKIDKAFLIIFIGIPIGISSFYRSPKLNQKVKGSKTSQHIKGEAMDIDADIFGGITNKEIFDYIKDNLDFHELIWEYGDDDNPAWVHVSLKRVGKNKKQILRIK